MKNGQLAGPGGMMVEFYTDSSLRERNTRFETLLANFLECFRARYEIIAWTRYVKKLEAHTGEGKEGKYQVQNQKQGGREEEKKEGENKNQAEEETFSFIFTLRRGAEPAPVLAVANNRKEPSDDTKTMAALLDDHASILRLIWERVNTSLTSPDGLTEIRWPLSDTVTDRLASGSGYDPRPHILALGELQKRIEAHTSTHMDGPPPLKKMKSSASGFIEPRTHLVVQRPPDSGSSRGPRKRRSWKGKARA
ncbi:hypothetical protein C8Q78DRAFT_1062729 [Trametes maxima]|nr:hypothetical protein C8Q78DRAFT_1062729 [Trametes maxima]